MNYEKSENVLQIGFFPRLDKLSGAKEYAQQNNKIMVQFCLWCLANG